MLLNSAVLLIVLANFACAILVIRKIKRIDLETWNLRSSLQRKIEESEFRLYRQLESLQALNATLDLPSPLPPLRDWAGSPDFLLELCREIKIRRPETIVECSSGASTVVAARCCQLNGFGHVFSLENGPEFAEKTRQLLRESGLMDWATVIDAPIREFSLSSEMYPWYSIDLLPNSPIDLLVIDGPPRFLRKHARYPAGPLLIPRLRNNGLIILDDADREDEKAIIQKWQDQFPGFSIEKRPAEKGLALLVKGDSDKLDQGS